MGRQSDHKLLLTFSMFSVCRVYPLEWHNLIGLRFNLLGCQSPSPKPNIRTTQGPDTMSTETPNPLSCMYWTPWVNTGTPDKVGEYETIYNLNQLVHSCDKKNMGAIECRDMATKMSHDKIGETGVQCDLSTVGGLLCKNDAQDDHQCNDYEIRVFCDECPTGKETYCLLYKNYVINKTFEDQLKYKHYPNIFHLVTVLKHLTFLFFTQLSFLHFKLKYKF